MTKPLVIGLGNTGHNIVKGLSNLTSFIDTTLFAIDSVYSNVELDDVSSIRFIGISADEKGGSGRSRERGAAMFKFHEEEGTFDELYELADDGCDPIIVVTSAAGGTGSGAVVPLCKHFIDAGLHVIPIIVCPNKKDPDAFHLNTNDLFIELGEVGVETYMIFENSRNGTDYTVINKEIVDSIEIILGKKYHGPTSNDSIDEADLDAVLSKSGRILAVSVKTKDIDKLKLEITRKAFAGYQPTWTEEDSRKYTLMTAYSLTSMFANIEYMDVFSEINRRLPHVYGEYRHIVQSDNDGYCEASIIIAGLPNITVRDISAEYEEAAIIGSGMKATKRPSFANRKSAHIESGNEAAGTKRKFVWKKD